MKTRTVTTLASIALLSFGLPAHADRGTRDPGVNARQQHQDQRIKQGVRSGELTKHEAKGLREDRRDIKQLEMAYKADGTLSGAERKDLHQELNKNSKNIYQQKHDGQDRNGSIRDPGVNARQENQTERIQQGVSSGELTRHEVKGLREDRRDIKQLETAYKSDGALTGAERKDLHQELNQLGGDIRQEKHDSQTP